MLVGVGTALVAFGALLAFTAAVLPRPDDDLEGIVESDRRRRNLHVTVVASAVAVLGGTALLFSEWWPWALVTLALAAGLYYAALVTATLRSRRWLVKEIEFARSVDKRPDGKPGRVWVGTAVWLKLAPEEWLNAGVPFYGHPEDPSSFTFADGVEKLATEQARLSWALRYPMGGGQTPLDILRGRLMLRRMTREARERARTVPTPVPTSAAEKPD